MFEELWLDAVGSPLHIYRWQPDVVKHRVLFWHGRSGTGLAITPAALILAQQYQCCVISIDAPGCGLSPLRAIEDYTMPALGSLVQAIVQQLDYAPFSFIGHSWGGSIGCYMASYHADLMQSLILLDAGYTGPEDWENYDLDQSIQETIELFANHRFESWEHYLTEMYKQYPRWSHDLERALCATMHESEGRIVSSVSPALIESIERAYAASSPPKMHHHLRASGLPILLLAATLPKGFHERRKGLIERFVQSVPQLKVEYLPDTPHDIPSYLGPDLAYYIAKWLI